MGKKKAKKAPAKKVAKKSLTPKQKKLDINKNGKLEGSDFAGLRAKKGMK
jgi:hypothetical protein